MLAHRNPHTAYRRVDFDARVSTASPAELVSLCYEQVISALGRALVAHERGDNGMKSDALMRAISALTALQMGVTGETGVAEALHQLYTAARHTVLNNVLVFNPAGIAEIRGDFVEIAGALAA